jgi:hypothetical protein
VAFGKIQLGKLITDQLLSPWHSGARRQPNGSDHWQFDAADVVQEIEHDYESTGTRVDVKRQVCQNVAFGCQ